MPPEPASGLPPDPDSATARPVEPFDSAADPFDNEVGRALLDALIGRLPEFVPTYLALAEACDDDPGEPVVFAELADFVADRLACSKPDVLCWSGPSASSRPGSTRPTTTPI